MNNRDHHYLRSGKIYQPSMTNPNMQQNPNIGPNGRGQVQGSYENQPINEPIYAYPNENDIAMILARLNIHPPKPIKSSSNEEDLADWVNRCEEIFSAAPNNFPTDGDKIKYAYDYVSGELRETLQILLKINNRDMTKAFKDWNHFKSQVGYNSNENKVAEKYIFETLKPLNLNEQNAKQRADRHSAIVTSEAWREIAARYLIWKFGERILTHEGITFAGIMDLPTEEIYKNVVDLHAKQYAHFARSKKGFKNRENQSQKSNSQEPSDKESSKERRKKGNWKKNRQDSPKQVNQVIAQQTSTKPAKEERSAPL